MRFLNDINCIPSLIAGDLIMPQANTAADPSSANATSDAASAALQAAALAVKKAVPPAKKRVPSKSMAAKAPAKASIKPAAKSKTKAVAKALSKTVTPRKNATPAAKVPVAATVKTAIAPKAAKHVKPKKLKIVRDSFTIPKTEYAVLDDLKRRALRSGLNIKKSELLRAGVMALAAMSDGSFLATLKSVPVIKTGRPSK
jgi:hypothetical protein